MQVKLYKTMASFPFICFSHLFFVVEHASGKKDRYDFLWSYSWNGGLYGNVYKNKYKVEEGFNSFYFKSIKTSPKLCHVFNLEESKEIYDVLMKMLTMYPYRGQYKLLSRNSNTFVKYVLKTAQVKFNFSWDMLG